MGGRRGLLQAVGSDRFTRGEGDRGRRLPTLGKKGSDGGDYHLVVTGPIVLVLGFN